MGLGIRQGLCLWQLRTTGAMQQTHQVRNSDRARILNDYAHLSTVDITSKAKESSMMALRSLGTRIRCLRCYQLLLLSLRGGGPVSGSDNNVLGYCDTVLVILPNQP